MRYQPIRGGLEAVKWVGNATIEDDFLSRLLKAGHVRRLDETTLAVSGPFVTKPDGTCVQTYSIIQPGNYVFQHDGSPRLETLPADQFEALYEEYDWPDTWLD